MHAPRVQATPPRGDDPLYLECGIHALGFARAVCSSSGHELLLAFSCKRRGVCPSESARRMSDTAVRLIDTVLSSVRLRQWVLSVPYELRIILAKNPAALSACGRFFVEDASVTATASEARERLVRYCAQAHLSLERLSVSHCGKVVYQLRHPIGKRTHRVIDAYQFVARLCALIPPPRHPLSRFHGVLAPNSAWRKEVVCSSKKTYHYAGKMVRTEDHLLSHPPPNDAKNVKAAKNTKNPCGCVAGDPLCNCL